VSGTNAVAIQCENPANSERAWPTIQCQTAAVNGLDAVTILRLDGYTLNRVAFNDRIPAQSIR
jgi:hypothetical protein